MMLLHPTLDKLRALKLLGMAAALEDQSALPDCASLSFEERLGLLVDRESTLRQNKALRLRLARAHLRQNACLEDLDFRSARGLDKSQILALASCDWIRRQENCILTGATGTGKSYLACALGQKACREGFEVRYRRVPRLFEELALARIEGSYLRTLERLGRGSLLILDDWGVAPFTAEQRRDMLELLDERYGRHSTLVAGQVPVGQWHDVIADPTLADAILDRLVHNAHKIALQGESMRKVHGGLTKPLSVPS
jgi:DNA replication protein DnaC